MSLSGSIQLDLACLEKLARGLHLSRSRVGLLLLYLGLATVEIARGGPVRLGFWIGAASSPSSHPTVYAAEDDAAAAAATSRVGLVPGAVLYRAGEIDLRGMNALEAWSSLLSEAGPTRSVELEFASAGARRVIVWKLTRGLPFAWRELLIAIGFEFA